MTTKLRKHSEAGGIVLFSLLGPLFATYAQSEGLGVDRLSLPATLKAAPHAKDFYVCLINSP